jgi:hypothetical protein
MNLLISGCSFTHWPEAPGSPNNICWPAALQKLNSNFSITNLAEPGAGNQYIANSVVNAVLTNPNHYDMVLVMWSGVSRLDFLTDLTDPAWHQLFDSYGFYRRLEQCPNKLGYIFSGGQLGPWTEHSAAKRMFAEQYKVSDHTSLGYINLIEIVKTQEFLKSQNIPYRFMSYVNYWTTGEHISPNGDFGVMGYPELRPLIDSIDFSPWIFHRDRECIYDLAKAADDYHGDRFHPGITTHQQWADLVYQQITC